MSWVDRLAMRMMPGAYSRYRMNLRRARALYEAEKPTRTFGGKKSRGGPNVATKTAPRNLREVAREFDESNDIASGALDILTANTIGAGLYPQPHVLDRDGNPLEEVNAQLDAWHQRWRRKPEVTWTCDELTAQRLACRTWFRDGEVLAQHIVGPLSVLTHGLDQVPYSYELLEPDYLPLESELHVDVTNGSVFAGIETNGWGRPVAYHLFREHPGDAVIFGKAPTKRVPADRISHLKLVKRIGQARGVSVFATVMTRLHDVREIDESERVAARIAAAFAAVIIKGDSFAYTPPNSDEETGYRELALEPGMIIDDLMPGEKVESIASNRPNNNLIEFRADQLRAAAAGIGASYSSLSKNYNGTYSAQRQEMVEQRMLYAPIWGAYVAQFEIPKYRNFIDALRYSGAVQWPASMDMNTLYDAVWTQPAMPWIDPFKEAAGWEKLLQMNVETRANVIRSRGGNPRDIARQRKLENEQNGPVVPTQGPGQQQS